jgi:hypothetical protein
MALDALLHLPLAGQVWFAPIGVRIRQWPARLASRGPATRRVGRRAAPAAGASFSHHAWGGGIWPDDAGMPDPPSRKRRQPTRLLSRPVGSAVFIDGRVRWLHRLPRGSCGMPRCPPSPGSTAGQTARPDSPGGQQHDRGRQKLRRQPHRRPSSTASCPRPGHRQAGVARRHPGRPGPDWPVALATGGCERRSARTRLGRPACIVSTPQFSRRFRTIDGLSVALSLHR